MVGSSVTWSEPNELWGHCRTLGYPSVMSLGRHGGAPPAKSYAVSSRPNLARYEGTASIGGRSRVSTSIDSISEVVP